MKARCLNPKHEKFSQYGAKGIGVAKRWLKFENFLADMGEPPKGTFLDRIKNKFGYSKRNCRWVTPKKSTENRSNTVWIKWRGASLRVNQFAKKVGLSVRLVYSRLHYGWTPVEIASKPAPIK